MDQIFILEDDGNFLKILEMRLKAWNKEAKTTVAKSIKEAKDLLEKTDIQFTLAVLDQHLPDGRGLELIDHPKLNAAAILAVSSDNAPELPGNTVKAGAQHFLSKRQVSEPLFPPLLTALVERKKIEEELVQARIKNSRYQSIQTLLATLRHEINNPLGAVIGGTFLLKSKGNLDPQQTEALKLIDESGIRIKHVIKQLCEAAELEEVIKGQETVYQVPGDKKWD
ncbi:MAG: response regulator [Proteobacteria bacterium]|nr:response regulator [Pseudomonadota bacterium]